MKHVRKVIEIDEELCNGCGECVPSCQEGAIQIVDGKAKLVADKYCDGLGACLGECPTGALKVVEREAEAFDEAAVVAHLEETAAEQPAPMPCGCPSAQAKSFAAAPAPAHDAPIASRDAPIASQLTHWPVQIRLVPPAAPFLKGCDLLVVADCVPISYARFHQDFLKDKVVMMGCPKFDDVEFYVERFTDIFATCGIKSVTVLVMQVPCCQGLPVVVQKALQAAGKDVPFKVVTISLQGEVVQ